MGSWMPEGLPGWTWAVSLKREVGSGGWRVWGDTGLCLQVFWALFYV